MKVCSFNLVKWGKLVSFVNKLNARKHRSQLKFLLDVILNVLFILILILKSIILGILSKIFSTNWSNLLPTAWFKDKSVISLAMPTYFEKTESPLYCCKKSSLCTKIDIEITTYDNLKNVVKILIWSIFQLFFIYGLQFKLYLVYSQKESLWHT